MYRLNRASVISVSVAIGRIIALKFEKITPSVSPCGASAGKIANLIAKIRISSRPSRNDGMA